MSPVFQLIRKKKLLGIGLIWLSGFCFGVAELIFSRAVPFQYGEQTMYDCRETFDDYWGRIYTLVIFVVTFAAPVVILIFVYSTIAYHILRHVIPGNPDCLRDENQINKKIKALIFSHR